MSDTATTDLSDLTARPAAAGGSGSGSPGGSSGSSSSSSSSSPHAAAPPLNAYERVIVRSALHARREDARARTPNRNASTLGELAVGAFAIRHRQPYGQTTAMNREVLLNPRIVPGGSTVRFSRGETVRDRARAFLRQHGESLSRWEERPIELDDRDGLLLPGRRRLSIWVRVDAPAAIAAHIERHASVGVNFLLHPGDAEPCYNHHLDARFIARPTGAPVAGAPFKAARSAAVVAAVTAAAHARHPTLPASEPVLVVPLLASLDFAGLSKRQSAAALLLQPLNYVGPFARSTDAFIVVAFVDALQLGELADGPAVRALKRRCMQEVWHQALGRPIAANHAAGGVRVGPIAGAGAAVRRMFLAPCLFEHDQLAQASECGIYANRCMICSMPKRHFADAELGSEAAASAQLRDRAAARALRATASSAGAAPAARRDALAELKSLGVQPEPHWAERLRYTNAAGGSSPLWAGCPDTSGTYREPLHQLLLGLVENTHRFCLLAIKRDGRGLRPSQRTRILQVMDKRARRAGLAFDDGATQPITAVTQLSASTKYTGDRRFDALFALSVALGTDARVIGDLRVLRRLQRVINALIATIEMERPFQFSQRQLDAYLTSQVVAADAFVAAFRGLMPSACNTTKLHAARCHRELECREGGAPSMRTAQHLERGNKAMVADYQGSNKRSLAGLPVRSTDEMAAQVIGDSLGLLDPSVRHTRPLGAASSVHHYPAIELQRSFTISASALRPVPAGDQPGVDDAEREQHAFAVDAMCAYADLVGWEHPEVVMTARVAAVHIPGRVHRPRLDSRKPVYAILGPSAAEVGELSLRTLRTARVLGFYQARIGAGPFARVKTLAVATDLVTCTVSSAVPADRLQARFCRDYAFTMVPVRTARNDDYDAGRASRFRALDFADARDVLQLGHVLRRAIYVPGVAGSATAHRGDFFLCIGKLLAGATLQPWDAGPADWLPRR